MFSAQELILELRHLALGRVECLAKLVGKLRLGTAAGLGKSGDRIVQPGLQSRRGDSEFLQQRPRQAIGLPDKREEKVLVGDFRIVILGRKVERCIQRLLHLGGEFVWSHRRTGRLPRCQSIDNRSRLAKSAYFNSPGKWGCKFLTDCTASL